jgi:hypothetical protein
MIEENDRIENEIELLLPWYEKGTLSAKDMQRVEAYLAAHPELRSQLGLIREEVAETIAGNEDLGMPGLDVRNRLMERIGAEDEAAPKTSPGFKDWLSRLLPSGLSPGLTFAAAAAGLVIAVQAVLLVSILAGGQSGDGYKVASGGENRAVSPGSFALIRFTGSAKADDIAGLLRSINAVIVDGPKPGGGFKIRISSKTLPAQERDAILQKLRERGEIVAFVAPAQ